MIYKWYDSIHEVNCLLLILNLLFVPLQLEKSSEEGIEVYKTMTDILRLVLHDKRLTAIEEEAMLEMSVFSE